MFEWFSMAGIKKEVKERIRWPKPKEMSKYSATVFTFIVLFMFYFMAADFVVALLMKLLGIVA
ncbi:MAG: preprotein translocase subunit SecE [Erysipelothrix sp.]|nr:preprotein translocase subunit SecE [Erysipelothrix sp.]